MVVRYFLTMTAAVPSLPTDPAVLRPLLHQKLDEASPSELEAVNKLLLELEIRRLADELGDEMDAAWADGRITQEGIEQAIKAHRQQYPYQ